MAVKADKKISAMTYEEAMAELEQISNQTGKGGLTLDQSVEIYARGVELSKHCSKLLAQAELRIKELDEELSKLSTANDESDSLPDPYDSDEVPF